GPAAPSSEFRRLPLILLLLDQEVENQSPARTQKSHSIQLASTRAGDTTFSWLSAASNRSSSAGFTTPRNRTLPLTATTGTSLPYFAASSASASISTSVIWKPWPR